MRFQTLAIVLLFSSCNYHAEYRTLQGSALGTTYCVIYEEKKGFEDVRQLVENTFREIDMSLSVYNPESIISKVNRNEPVVLDSMFIRVFERGKEIYALTGGAFDMAAAPYFDLWGFGFTHRERVTQAKLDSIAVFAGMDKIGISNGEIEKADHRVSLNANAIAKGYCSDVVAFRLRDAGVVNLLVEIGGEIRCEGVNARGRAWRIAIDSPQYGNFIPGREIEAKLLLSGRSLATSGNYRNYYEEDGIKYGHTIDPSTGSPAKNTLLSATVLASDCMTADALATAFMVMGVKKTKAFLNAHPEVDAYLIYSDDSGEYRFYSTQNITFF